MVVGVGKQRTLGVKEHGNTFRASSPQAESDIRHLIDFLLAILGNAGHLFAVGLPGDKDFDCSDVLEPDGGGEIIAEVKVRRNNLGDGELQLVILLS